MSTSTPDEFASLLGLSKGLDAGPAKLIGPRDRDKASAIIDAINPHSHLAEPFWDELGASYLPSFLRTYFQTPFNLTEKNEQHSYSWVMMTRWVRNLIFAPSFPRFVRDHQDEARSFYLILTERAANLPEWAYKTNSFFPVQFFPRFIPFLRVFAQVLAVHLPAPGLPPLSLTTRNGITSMLINLSDQMPRLQSSLPANAFEDLKESVVVCYGLGADSGTSLMAKCKARIVCNSEGTVWWGCEFAKGKAGMGGRECAKLGGGKDMMACGRCMSVRYCSREHQRAHWKVHKLYCFQSSW